MARKEYLLVLDFDGFLINSYSLLKATFEEFGLDIGDESRFKNRRKFMKYLGGGREFLRNLVKYSLPKKKKIRQQLTEQYVEHGIIYSEFVPLLNRLITSPAVHIGIISRNYTLTPGETIRAVLKNSDVDEADLDFVIPIPTGVKKNDVLTAMKSSRYSQTWFGGDEVGDFHAACETGYDNILIGSYGFDTEKRLIDSGKVPESIIFPSPKKLVRELERYFDGII